MVAFSGGNDIRGPQAAGILIGRQDLMHYVLQNVSPLGDRICRCCKVGKETIFGMLKALELFVTQEYDATLRTYDECAQVITDAIERFGVTALPRQFDPQALGNVTPRYSWKVNRSRLSISGQEVMQKLADTRPLQTLTPVVMDYHATQTAPVLQSGSSKTARINWSPTGWLRSSA